MEEEGNSGAANAKSLGNAFAVAGFLAGCVGLFAGGILAGVGTFLSIACMGGVFATGVLAEHAESRQRAIESRGWPAPSIEEETPAISQAIDSVPPGKSWVASLETQRQASRSR